MLKNTDQKNSKYEHFSRGKVYLSLNIKFLRQGLMINLNLNHILTTLQLNLIKLTLSQRNLIEFHLKYDIKMYGVRHKFNLLIQS